MPVSAPSSSEMGALAVGIKGILNGTGEMIQNGLEGFRKLFVGCVVLGVDKADDAQRTTTENKINTVRSASILGRFTGTLPG